MHFAKPITKLSLPNLFFLKPFFIKYFEKLWITIALFFPTVWETQNSLNYVYQDHLHHYHCSFLLNHIISLCVFPYLSFCSCFHCGITRFRKLQQCSESYQCCPWFKQVQDPHHSSCYLFVVMYVCCKK